MADGTTFAVLGQVANEKILGVDENSTNITHAEDDTGRNLLDRSEGNDILDLKIVVCGSSGSRSA